MPRVPTENLVAETMATRSGTIMLAREVNFILRQVYNRQASTKSISKILLKLDYVYPLLNRRETTNKEKARYNCRYMYVYGHFHPETGELQ